MADVAVGMSRIRQERLVKESDAAESSTHNGRFRHAVWAPHSFQTLDHVMLSLTKQRTQLKRGLSLALACAVCLLLGVGDDQHPRTLDSPACCVAAVRHDRLTSYDLQRFTSLVFCFDADIRCNRPQRSAEVRTGPQAHTPGNQCCLGFCRISSPSPFSDRCHHSFLRFNV
jgi:hypothetical protein